MEFEICDFGDLKGKIIKKIEGMEQGSEYVEFLCETGEVYRMFHYQDCCEYVVLEDVIGSIYDLLHTPITMSEETTNIDEEENYESSTWTFYKLATIKGYVTLRWLGISNGYYSEAVYFEKSVDKYK